jgi:hypothetical protein
MSVTRDELHRLLDEMDSEDLEQVGDYVRHLVGRRRSSVVTPRRRFRTMGSFAAEPDYAERSKEIRRSALAEGEQPS